ncbi:ABC transporter ATP-binding protein [Hoeflea sp. WL0058]|uniref:ABC transporter ATP-binding protein n=1 Tax=Flavimaribacter sediminis TaxID=2865987 RepID=A0AAE2ZGN6_9HYPH|nr:ABC transporter ATP-binding protein [Flavimaribacter sediminis]MBW8636243.1 ABC transporter ATP-binding protein [Flavimaribacter sediminis]
MLELANISVSYGFISALKDVSLNVDEGEIVALIGSNGAGKSTLINTCAGLVRPGGGEIRLRDRALLKTPSYKRAELGIAVVPENRRLFGEMSVRDNLCLGAFSRSSMGRMPDLKQDIEMVFALFPRLAERQSQRAMTMSGGEQQMLAIGRALMSRPQIILMDEPSIGLAPKIVARIFEVIRQLREQGKTILLAEQNAAASLRIADRAYVLELGRITMQGKASELWEQDKIRKLYLGENKT